MLVGSGPVVDPDRLVIIVVRPPDNIAGGEDLGVTDDAQVRITFDTVLDGQASVGQPFGRRTNPPDAHDHNVDDITVGEGDNLEQ